MLNLYETSWELYKEHSSVFLDDRSYYLNLTRGHTTLEMFAGYGRIANFLAANNVNVETVELSPDFSRNINLPANKKHIADVTKFRLEKQFERIIAAYNSFCLLTDTQGLNSFFENVAEMLTVDGFVSLSYYHPDAWSKASAYDFEFKGETISYVPSFDLSKRKEKQGVWIDTYRFRDQEISAKYPVRIFEDFSDIAPFLRNSGLKLKSIVTNYNNPEITEDGWQEYVLSKS
jgi:cyclopropane fatty-acyl-phospholipid synthase-like methyltransferase